MRIILFFLMLFNSAIFAGEIPTRIVNTTNASITCPAKKYCKVDVNYFLYIKAAGSVSVVTGLTYGNLGSSEILNRSNDSMKDFFSLTIRGGDVLNCTSVGIPSVSLIAGGLYTWKLDVTCTLNGTNVYKSFGAIYFKGISAVNFNTTIFKEFDYSFTSSEYNY